MAGYTSGSGGRGGEWAGSGWRRRCELGSCLASNRNVSAGMLVALRLHFCHVKKVVYYLFPIFSEEFVSFYNKCNKAKNTRRNKI